MQTLDDTIYKELDKAARKRGINVQELIRAVIVPEWVTTHNGIPARDQTVRTGNHWR